MRLYDTLTGKEEEFTPLGDQVKMYVCGVTPYGPCHVGHAMSYIIFDVLRRYLEFHGFQVKHVQNFTDVDDKIIHRAQEQGITYRELGDQYIQEYRTNMDRLNVKPAERYPLVTDEIPNIVEIIAALINKGYAYSSDGNVYFRITKDKNYGKLSHRSLKSMIAGARVKVEEGKEHPMDFTLWKVAKPGEPAWDSPWGLGRPGWHIECTTICLNYLGETLDIHGGGQDLVFPHHENEIAQSEAYTGRTPFVRFWVHNGLLHLGEDKMSKSRGNLVEVGEALEQCSADALRLFFLSSHYRSPLTYSDEGLAAMERATERLRNALREGPQEGDEGPDLTPFEDRFITAMDSDLNTPQALAVLFDLARQINRARERGQRVTKAQETLQKLGDILGLTFQEAQEPDTLPLEPFTELLKETSALLHAAGHHKLAGRVDSPPRPDDVVAIIDTLLAVRWELRRAQEYSLADRIRSGLAKLGVNSEDTPDRTLWRRQRPAT